MPRAPRVLIPVLSVAAVASMLLRRAGGRTDPTTGPPSGVRASLAARAMRRPSRPPLTPAPVAPRSTATWLEPDDGTCPEGYLVKAKLTSGIFHEPGGRHYARTTPDRCYASATAARADGLRPARR